MGKTDIYKKKIFIFNLPGQIQSPAPILARTSTLPYWKLKDFAVRILALLIGFNICSADPVRTQPFQAELVHLKSSIFS